MLLTIFLWIITIISILCGAIILAFVGVTVCFIIWTYFPLRSNEDDD